MPFLTRVKTNLIYVIFKNMPMIGSNEEEQDAKNNTSCSIGFVFGRNRLSKFTGNEMQGKYRFDFKV